MESWVRIGIFALILVSFLRRILKARTRNSTPSPTAPGNLPATMQSNLPSTIRPTLVRPFSGRKNDFRDVPPPPENPELG